MIARKLCTSPNYTLAQSADGAAFVTAEVEPYHQFWLDRRERLLFALFARRGGMAVAEATECLVRMAAPADEAAERRRLARAIAGMEQAGVLIAPGGELSRYGQGMARDYLRHRPFPQALADRIAALAPPGRNRVLDLAAGPGSLSLELARRGADVTIMELSRGFVAAAKSEARARGLALGTIHESCNRLPQHEGQYDLITISQAIHWLDDVALVRGVLRCLAEGGSFVVVHGSLTLPDDHPIAPVLGRHTPLGDKVETPFAEQVRALLRRLSLLIEALGTEGVDRHEAYPAPRGLQPLRADSASLHRQDRPIDPGFARAFLSDRHVAAFGMEPAQFWPWLDARCAAASDLTGTQEWAMLHFRRGASGLVAEEWAPGGMEAIAYP
jgi:SAM-dependent methyltransferase